MMPDLKRITLNTQLFIAYALVSLTIFVVIVVLSFFFINEYSASLKSEFEDDMNSIIYKSVSSEHNRLRSLIISHAFSTDLLDASEIHDTDWININTNHYLYDNPSQRLSGSMLVNHSSNFSELKGILPQSIYDTLAKQLSDADLVAGATSFLLSHYNRLYLVSIAGLTDTDHENLRGYFAVSAELDTRILQLLSESYDAKATVHLDISGSNKLLTTMIDDEQLPFQIKEHLTLYITSIKLVDNIREQAGRLLLLISSLYALAGAIMLLFLRRITTNFESTIERIKSITYNDYSEQLHINYSKDFYELGECINNLSSELSKRDLSISKKYIELISILIKTLEEVDVYTRGHSERVSHYSVEIAKTVDFPNIELIRLSGLMHDIGKITVDTKILNKPSSLSPEEFEEIKKHPQTAYSILDMSETFNDIKDIVKAHHEKFDGSGYPDGLSGPAIPLGARIIAIADVFDSLTSERSYRKPMPLEEALDIIVAGSGAHFDPQLVNAFIGIAPQLYEQWSSLNNAPEPIELLMDHAFKLNHTTPK